MTSLRQRIVQILFNHPPQDHDDQPASDAELVEWANGLKLVRDPEVSDWLKRKDFAYVYGGSARGTTRRAGPPGPDTVEYQVMVRYPHIPPADIIAIIALVRAYDTP